MAGPSPHPAAPIPEAELIALGQMEIATAADTVRAAGRWEAATATQLADAALARADAAGDAPTVLLGLAEAIAEDLSRPPSIVGPIEYARARVAVHHGRLAEAEEHLAAAQLAWQATNDEAALTRSNLGFIQVLAMQGRYTDALTASDDAITGLTRMADADGTVWLLLARANRNRGTLLVYQEQHERALAAYRSARAALEAYVSDGAGEMTAEAHTEVGHIALNEASAHTFLDDRGSANAKLTEAIQHFEAAGDTANRGRARTNLGRLFLRIGDYPAALLQFDLATADLLGQDPADMDDIESLRRADELLLEHASAYLALNLLPEAERMLERCERLFRTAGQPYELAQARYTQGLYWLRLGEWEASQAALTEAAAIFSRLGNTYWFNQCRTGLIRLGASRGDVGGAIALADEHAAMASSGAGGDAVVWDVAGLAELWLLRAQLALDTGNLEAAHNMLEQLAETLGTNDPPALPHLTLRLNHARGRVAAARGEATAARLLYARAVDMLDTQRGALPLEEVRTAFLEDKMQLYSDLVLSLLDRPSPAANEVAAAFAVVERARSRSLLERLMASMDDADVVEQPEYAQRRAELRRELHWLYNQLMGESGSRTLEGMSARVLAAREATIQQEEWRSSPFLAQVEPAELADLQSRLEDDQQAILFYFAGDELLCFVVGRNDAQVVRDLSQMGDVEHALSELRFQMGRAELGDQYVARHRDRLATEVRRALSRLYVLVMQPLRRLLRHSRLLIAPFGPLHMLPFHALWDGQRYLLESFEVTYAPSASVAVHCADKRLRRAYRRFAGLAPHDTTIPQAEAEVRAAARYFPEATTLLNDDATEESLRRVAATADILHLATHGLFRPDNPYFSALKLTDGWLDVREIYRMRPAARLVVLSACESGMGAVRGGDEVVGLARGFLASGADTLVASLWNVHDMSAARLMGRFYGALQRGQGGCQCMRPAAALRTAQLAAVNARQHPYYWAPFFVIG